MPRRLFLLALVPAMLVAEAGCRHCCKRSASPRLDPPVRDRDLFIPPPAGGLPTERTLPADPAAPPPPTIRSEPPGSRYRPQRETLYPDPLLEAPEIKKSTGEPPAVLPLSDGKANKAVVPAGYADRTNSPTGLPGYAVVADRLATGRKPTVEGFDSLKATGFRTMVYLHEEGKDVSATRELAEKKGFAFIGIAVSPTNLKTAFNSFAEAVGDKANRPAYVFDDTGVRTGSLWYLYFRTVESFSDDTAQVKAAPLGLRDAAGDERTKFWLAVQDYLSKR